MDFLRWFSLYTCGNLLGRLRGLSGLYLCFILFLLITCVSPIILLSIIPLDWKNNFLKFNLLLFILNMFRLWCIIWRNWYGIKLILILIKLFFNCYAHLILFIFVSISRQIINLLLTSFFWPFSIGLFYILWYYNIVKILVSLLGFIR